MDKRLEDTLNKVKEEKHTEEHKLQEEAERRHLEREKYIRSCLLAAEKWINEVLFDKIAEQEKRNNSQGYSRKDIILHSYENGVPAEAIIKVAEKISGLHAYAKWEYDRIYECDSRSGSYTYIIEWGDKSK